MNHKLILPFLLLLVLAVCENEPRAVEVSTYDKQHLSIPEFVELVVSQQPAITKKAVQNFLAQEVEALLKTRSHTAVKQEVANWFSVENLPKVTQKINSYVRARLWTRLEMEKLSQSLKKQINHNPESYFLTYDMYDLLIDE